jgi:hypothetical protein
MKQHDSKTCPTCKELWEAAKWCSQSRLALGSHLNNVKEKKEKESVPYTGWSDHFGSS